MTMTAVAGASGALGREVVRALRARGHRVVGIVRNLERARGVECEALRVADALCLPSLAPALTGCTRLVSCIGASVSPSSATRAGFIETDVPTNRNLIEAARDAKLVRFVYV